MDAVVLLYNFIIAVFGVVLNGLVILVISKRPEKDVTSFFVIVMSLSDSLYLLAGPFTLFIISTEHFTFPCAMYELQTVLTHFASAEISLVLCIMSIERFVGIAFVVVKSPQCHRKIFKYGSVLTSVLLFTTYCSVLYLFAFRYRAGSCGIMKSFSYFDIIVQFVLPGTAIIISVSYIIISFRRLNHPQTHAQIISVQTIVFICLSAVFAIFASPLYVFELWMVNNWTAYDKRIHILVVTLYNTQAAIKLIVYISFEEEFRREFVAMATQWFRAIKKDYSGFNVERRRCECGPETVTEQTEGV